MGKTKLDETYIFKITSKKRIFGISVSIEILFLEFRLLFEPGRSLLEFVNTNSSIEVIQFIVCDNIFTGWLNPYQNKWRNFVEIIWKGGVKIGAIFLKSSENDKENWKTSHILIKKGKYVLKKTDLFQWMLELCRPILVLTTFWRKTISAGKGGGAWIWGKKEG